MSHYFSLCTQLAGGKLGIAWLMQNGKLQFRKLEEQVVVEVYWWRNFQTDNFNSGWVKNEISKEPSKTSRQNGDIWGLLLLVRLERRCGGISAVAFLELPGRVRQWQRVYVRRRRRQFGDSFFTNVSSVHRNNVGHRTGAGLQVAWEERLFTQQTPALWHAPSIGVGVYKMDKGKLGF